MTDLASIDSSYLALVAGGQGLNTDTAESRLGVTRVYGVPVPVQTVKSNSTRTEFGKCVDGSSASCERQGGSNEKVGTCMLNGIEACAKRDK
jgi:hypothetical protein